ncbi:hypothetical protein SAMN05519104_1638 [Rhizobiales bacterium GAS188]|nr:hypothetical protein SAMN05519104_1638 [Rhizobiales bacterium GAS188]
MSVSTIGTGSSAIASYYRQRKRDLNSLESAVESGDLTNAQKALTAYRQDGAAIDPVSGSQASAQGGYQPGDPQSVLASLLGAIQSGGMVGAKNDLNLHDLNLRDPNGFASDAQNLTGGSAGSELGQDLFALLQAAQSTQGANAQQGGAVAIDALAGAQPVQPAGHQNPVSR